MAGPPIDDAFVEVETPRYNTLESTLALGSDAPRG
jgi:hypothetical protein